MPIHEITPQRIHHHKDHAVEGRNLPSCYPPMLFTCRSRIPLVPSSKTRQHRLIREEACSKDQDRNGE